MFVEEIVDLTYRRHMINPMQLIWQQTHNIKQTWWANYSQPKINLTNVEHNTSGKNLQLRQWKFYG